MADINSPKNCLPANETVLVELCKMWSSAMRMAPENVLDPNEMKKIGDRLLNTEAKSVETILLKLRSAHATAERSLDDGHPVRNLLSSTIEDLNKLER